MRFRDRQDAGRQLGQRLLHLRDQHAVVLALPRGGVVVGFEIAAALDAPLDIVPVRKIGAPFQPEYGIGAIVDGEAPQVVLDDAVVAELGIPQPSLQHVIDREIVEIRRREQLYREGRPRPALTDRTLILVDDGIATGSSVRAALRALRRHKPRRLVLAVPVAAPQGLSALEPLADETVCLSTPFGFAAVGQFYDNFEQVEDAEVIDLLNRARAFGGGAAVEPVERGAKL